MKSDLKHMCIWIKSHVVIDKLSPDGHVHTMPIHTGYMGCGLLSLHNMCVMVTVQCVIHYLHTVCGPLSKYSVWAIITVQHVIHSLYSVWTIVTVQHVIHCHCSACGPVSLYRLQCSVHGLLSLFSVYS